MLPATNVLPMSRKKMNGLGCWAGLYLAGLNTKDNSFPYTNVIIYEPQNNLFRIQLLFLVEKCSILFDLLFSRSAFSTFMEYGNEKDCS